MMHPLLARLLRQPLLQFVLIGALIFGVYELRAGDAETAPTDIRVGAAELQWLYDTWKAQFGHTPSATEMQSAIRGHVQEEMRYREALALGLDRDDTIVRRRLAQKYDFLLGRQGAELVPTEAQLKALYERQPTLYSRPALTRFCQVYFGAGAAGLADAKAALAALSADAYGRPDAVGGGRGELPYPRCYEDASVQDVSRDFGPFFAGVVERLPVGRWQGPVESGYGFHVVLPQSRSATTPLPFAEARPAVAADWRKQAAEDARTRTEADLRERYRVRVDDGALKRLMAAPRP